ncbi:transposase [Candidatus Roizmanbacteria bacterium]|nr:transposase [Candidatus Roizmanbacteria bacterium]
MRPKLVNGEIYHICNKSIANFGIFKNEHNCKRFLKAVDFYNNIFVWSSLSQAVKRKKYVSSNLMALKNDGLIKILSYCIVPDHYHLLFKVQKEYPISKYINDIENSYTRYFNVKYNRKGPLWQSRYRCVLIKSDEQLLHTSRYIHLNPSTGGLVEQPEDWIYSSYRDLIFNPDILQDLKEISIRDGETYRRFVEDNLDYQKNLKRIKNLILD